MGGVGRKARPYLRQLIRDTHIAGQLFKAHSCITQARGSSGLAVSFPSTLDWKVREKVGGEGGAGREKRERDAIECSRVCVCVCVCVCSAQATPGQSHPKSALLWRLGVLFVFLFFKEFIPPVMFTCIEFLAVGGITWASSC